MKQIRILDWKTSRKDDSDYVDQMKGYGWLLLQEHPDADSVYAVIGWIRDQRIEAYTWSREELDTWHAQMVAKAADVEVYNPGRHCSFCPRCHECPARVQVLKTAMRVLEISSDDMLPAEIGQLFDAAKALEKAVEDALKIVRSAVAIAGGVLPLPGGRELRLELQESQVIKFDRGIQALESMHLLTNDVRQSIKIPKGAVCDAAKASVPKGRGAAAVRELMDALEQADALETVTKEIMSARKAR
jgi:hypothetical protein